MTGGRAATRYAKAILSYAKDNNVLDAVQKDMSSIIDTVKNEEDLGLLIQSPIIKASVKKKTLNLIFPDFCEATDNLINLLLENNRIDLVGTVADKFMMLYDELMGKQDAFVTTAVPLTGELEKKLLEKVTSLTGKSITLINKVDESIIGGFILRVGDLEYNASIANKLYNLKRDFINKVQVSN